VPYPAEIAFRLKGVENAIAQQRLEGIEPSAPLAHDLERAARGEISVREAIDNIGKRAGDAEIRESRPLP